jgi:hypothetical protein
MSDEIQSYIVSAEQQICTLKKQLKRLEDCNECYLTDNIYLIHDYPYITESTISNIIIESGGVKIICCDKRTFSLNYVCLNQIELNEFRIKILNKELDNITSNIKSAEKSLIEQKEIIERFYIKKESIMEEMRKLI